MTGPCHPSCALGLDPCHARTSGVARYCELVRGELAELAAGRTPETAYRTLVAGRPVSAPPPQLAPANYGAQIRAVARCPYAGPSSPGCGCRRQCWRHGREVALVECYACVPAPALISSKIHNLAF